MSSSSRHLHFWALIASILLVASAQARDLYWTDNDKRILASDIDGGNVTVIFDGNTSSPQMDGVAVDVVATATHIYWTDNPPAGETGGGIWRANRDGSNPERFLSAPGGTANLHFLAISEGSGMIYFSDYVNGLYEANLANGGGVRRFATGSGFTGMVMDPNPSFGVDELLVLSASSNSLIRAIPDWGSASGERTLEGGNATYGIAYHGPTRTVYYTNHSEGTLRSYSYLTNEHQLYYTPGMVQPLDLQLSPSGTHLLIAERGKGITAFQLSNHGYELLVPSTAAHFGVAVTADPADLPDPPPPPPPPGPGDLIFVADFEGDTVGQFPRTMATGGVWEWVIGPDNGTAEVVYDVDDIFGFGEENKFFRVKNANNVQMRGRFAPTKVASMSFDFIGQYDPPTDGNRWMNMSLQVGGGRVATASLRLSNATVRTHLADHESYPTPQGYEGPINPSYGGNYIPLRINIIGNNSAEAVTYTGPDNEEYLLSAGYSTVWVHNYNTGIWTQVLPEFDFERQAAADQEIDTILMLVDSNVVVRSFDIDNIHVRMGAVIDGPEARELTYPDPPVLVLHDDFNHTPPTAPGVDRIAPEDYNGPLSLSYWAGAEGKVRIVQDVNNVFGRGTQNQVLALEDANALRLEAAEMFLTGAITLSFDIFQPGALSTLGTDRLSARFFAGGMSGGQVINFGLEQRSLERASYFVRGMEGLEILGGHVQRYTLVVNNMEDEITYPSPNGPQTLGAGQTAIWLNGYLLAEPYSFDRTALTGTAIDSFQLATFVANYWQGYLDNIRIWEGAFVPDPDVPGRDVEPQPKDLLVYDGFSYSTGSLSGRNGGDGWAGGYLAVPLRDDVSVVSPGLSYPDLPSTGNRLLAAGGARNERVIATNEIHSSLLSPYADHLGGAGSSLWMSFLARGLATEAAGDWQTVLIDINGTDVPGAPWNTVGPTSATDVPLANTDGVATGWTASLAGWRSSTVRGNIGAFEGTIFEQAADDYYFVQDGEIGTLTIAGLNPARTYKVEVISSRAAGTTTNRRGNITVNGQFADSNPSGEDYHSRLDGFLAGMVPVWEAAVPDAQGNLVVAVESITFSYLSALRITEGTAPGWGVSLYRDTFHHNDRVLFVGKGPGEETGLFGEAPHGWKLEGGYGSTTARAFSGVPYDELSLFVVRIDYDDAGNQTARLFRNPSLGGAAPADHEAVAVIETALGSFGFDRIRIDGVGAGFEFDELRIGTSFAAVTSGGGAAPTDGYAAWLEDNFGSETDPAIVGPGADPDGDGVKNLIEYALGLDPLTASRDGLPYTGVASFTVNSVTSDYLTLTFTRPDAVTDVAYEVTASGDLGSWLPGVAVLEEVTSNGDGTTTYLYRDGEPLDTAGRRFLRLEISVLE